MVCLASRDNTAPSRKPFPKTGLLVSTSYEIRLSPLIPQLHLALKTRAGTTDPLRDAPQPGALPAAASLRFPSGQPGWEGAALVSQYIPSVYVKTQSAAISEPYGFLQPCKILVPVGVGAHYKQRQELQQNFLYRGRGGSFSMPD